MASITEPKSGAFAKTESTFSTFCVAKAFASEGPIGKPEESVGAEGRKPSVG